MLPVVMTQWETSASVTILLTAELYPEKNFLRCERTEISSALAQLTSRMRPAHPSPMSNCISRTITLLQSLRVAHQSKRFSRPDRNWIATSHPDGVFLPPRLFTFTIEYLLCISKLREAIFTPAVSAKFSGTSSSLKIALHSLSSMRVFLLANLM